MYFSVYSFLSLPERRHSLGITVTAARYSSEDAVILVEYVLSLLEYTKRYAPYKKVLDYITELSAEQEEHEKLEDEERYSEVDLQEERVCISSLPLLTYRVSH